MINGGVKHELGHFIDGKGNIRADNDGILKSTHHLSVEMGFIKRLIVMYGKR
jgi:hypothetical protein